MEMSADINAEIILRGKKEELLAFIIVLRIFERDKLTNDQAGEECAYIEFVELDNGMDEGTLELHSQIQASLLPSLCR